MGAPPDEYECVVGSLLRLFEERQPVSNVAEYLDGEFVEHFGEPPRAFGSRAFATQTQAWYEERWADSTA
jgi:hypothetical protein